MQKFNVKYFPQTTAELASQEKSLDHEAAKDYGGNLTMLKTESETRFSHFKAMESVISLIAVFPTSECGKCLK